VVVSAAEFGICCPDEWQVPTQADIDSALKAGHPAGAQAADEAFHNQRKMLVNTASSVVLVLKHLGYWCEVITGLFMVVGMLAIWWFSVERSFDLDEDILDELPRLASLGSQHYSSTP